MPHKDGITVSLTSAKSVYDEYIDSNAIETPTNQCYIRRHSPIEADERVYLLLHLSPEFEMHSAGALHVRLIVEHEGGLYVYDRFVTGPAMKWAYSVGGLRIDALGDFPDPAEDSASTAFGILPWQHGLVCVYVSRGFHLSFKQRYTWTTRTATKEALLTNTSWHLPESSWKALDGSNGDAVSFGIQIRSMTFDVTQGEILTKTLPERSNPSLTSKRPNAGPKLVARPLRESEASTRIVTTNEKRSSTTLRSIRTHALGGREMLESYQRRQRSKQRPSAHSRLPIWATEEDQDDEEVKPPRLPSIQSITNGGTVITAPKSLLGKSAVQDQISRAPTAHSFDHGALRNNGEVQPKPMQQQPHAVSGVTSHNCGVSDTRDAGVAAVSAGSEKRNHDTMIDGEEDVEELNDQLRGVEIAERKLELEEKKLEIKRKLGRLSRRVT
ncbi:hypothetical protein LTR27_008330 [Elasticomyces elasticus]|nr:hypothetical protein LTR27_008330 [Elasticomyces elasticus]